MSLYRGYFGIDGADPLGLCYQDKCGAEYEKGVVRLQWTMGDKERIGWEVEMKAKITDCNLETRTSIQQMLTDGYAAIRLISLSGLTKEDPCVKKFFGELTDKQFKRVVNRINKIKGKFEKNWTLTKGFEFAFKCECQCTGKHEGVRAGILGGKQATTGQIIGLREISLCPRFFKEDKKFQTFVLLHEAVHLAGAVDWGYWNSEREEWTDSFDRPIDIGPKKLINTADAYEEFFKCWVENKKKKS